MGDFCPLGSGSGYGSTGLIESGSHPDPKHWFYYFNNRIDLRTFNFSANQLWRRSRQQSRGTRTGRGNSSDVTNQRHYGELAGCSTGPFTGPRTALCAMRRRSTGHGGPLRRVRPSRQRCRKKRNYFLRFRVRLRLLKSCGSGSNFWKDVSGSGSYFWKVTVLVPVQKMLENFFTFLPYLVSCFTRK